MDYSIATFWNNAEELGVWPALSEDWQRTKQHFTASLESLLRSIRLEKASTIREEADYLEPGQKVIVKIPVCSDCDSTIPVKGIILAYLGKKDPTYGMINGYPLENHYWVQLRKGEEITCFESNLH